MHKKEGLFFDQDSGFAGIDVEQEWSPPPSAIIALPAAPGDEGPRRPAFQTARTDADVRADINEGQAAGLFPAVGEGRMQVVEDDEALGVARLVLPHRRRRQPFDQPGAVDEQQSKTV